MAPAGNKSFRLSRASHVEYKYLPTYLPVSYIHFEKGEHFSYLTIPGLDINKLDSDALCSLLLFGSKDLNIVENRIIIEATISFINATKRFD